MRIIPPDKMRFWGRWLIFILLFFALIHFTTQWVKKHYHEQRLAIQQAKNTAYHPRSWQEILASDTLRAVCPYNSIDYYVEEDTIKGFQYELIQAFGQSHHLYVQVIPEMDLHKQLLGLTRGQYDLAIGAIASTQAVKDTLLMTRPLLQTQQVLIQRKPGTVHSLLDLAGDTIFIPVNSPAVKRIHHLSEEIGDSIHVVEVAGYGEEQLMAMVAAGEISLTVCNLQTASVLMDSLPQLAGLMPISFTQFYAWGIPKHNPELREALNKWIDSIKDTRWYKTLYHQYYNNVNE